jgi:uncharacterized protein YhaN
LASVNLLAENAAVVVQSVQLVLASQGLETHHQNSRLEQAKHALSELHIEESLLIKREEIEALNEQRIKLAGHVESIAAKKNELVQIEAREADLRQALDWTGAPPSTTQRRELVDLLAQQVQWQQALQADEQAFAVRQAELGAAQSRLQELGVANESLALRLAVEQAQQLGDVQERLARLDSDVARYERALTSALAALGPWPMTISQLEALVLPSRQEIARLTQEDQAQDISLRGLRHRQVEIESSMANLRQKLSQAQISSTEVSDDMLVQARRERDAAWQSLRQSPDALLARATEFSLLLREADLLADQRMAELAAAGQLLSERAGLATLEQDLSSLLRTIALEQTLQENLQKSWTAQTHACGLPGLPVSAAENWLAARERALEAQVQLVSAQQSRAELAKRVDSARDALASALQIEGKSFTFAFAYARAQERLELQGQHRGERRALEVQIANEQRVLAQLQLQLAASRSSQTSWLSNWQRALTGIGKSVTSEPAQMQSFLELCEKLDDVVQVRERLQHHELRELESQLLRFETAVRALAVSLSEPDDSASPSDLMQALMRRLRLSLDAQQERTRLLLVQQESEDALRELSLGAERARASLMPLLAASGVQSIESLLGMIAQSEQKRALISKIELANEQIGQAADGFTLAQLREQCQLMQGQDLALRSEQLQAQEQPLSEAMERLVGQREKAFVNLEAFSGQASAATAEAQRQEALSAMAEAAQRYIAVHTAARLLRWSVDRFRQVQQGPMLAAASQVFARLSQHSFSSLMVDFEVDPPELLGRRANGERLKINQMSEGTRDQLYLALRIAALELHCRHAQALPFVADDLFINFDDGRSAAGLEALGELSRHTQVIFLTHHSHLVPLIEDVFADGVNVVKI